MALGDPTRLELLQRLADGRAHSIVDLARGLPMSRQGVTKHLLVLEDAGLVASRRVGRENRFVFSPDSVAGVRSWLERISAQWEEALARLQAHLAEPPG